MIHKCDAATLAQIKTLLAPILTLRGQARQDKLASLGFAIRDSGNRKVLTTWPHGLPICELG
ncbi:hypothetical protein KO498_10970 [Lentibacter algarum]|uniref:hypothetical protein n=1 Tax=Lentibacter algarum TaxID=576131 RepID=UPI001C06F961|nr:hypothetical protein [Lentibacter algarum]MBU2982328.1 hypothetical protein [Lentibacter algarum]